MFKLSQLNTRLTLIGAAVTMSLTSINAVAQEQPAAESDDVEVIMVTARKRAESLYETPSAISSLGAEMMDSANVGNLDDVGKYVPNLNITRYGVGNTAHAAVFIRGIGLQDHIITTDPGVGVYLDGVYLGRQMGANMSLPNIQRVEVLRGPQGTLYGRNTLGGAVNIITTKPGEDGMASASFKAGTRNRLASEVYVNTMLTDTFGFSASASYKKRDGVGRAVNLINPQAEIGEEQEFSGRMAGRWQLSNDFSLTVAYDTVNSHGGQSPYTIEFTDPVDPNDFANGDFPLLTPDMLPADPDDLGTTVAGIEANSNSGDGWAVTAEWQVSPSLTAKVIGSYRDSEYTGGLDDDASPLHLSEFPENGEATQKSLELQINGYFDNMDFVSGLYYFTEDGKTESGPWVFSPWNTPDGLNTDGSPSFGDYGYFDLHQDTTAYAAYINVSYDVSDKLSVGGGLRYSDDSKDADAWFPTFPERKYVQGDYDEVTWDMNLSYQIDSDLNFYAQVQKGYQTGGFPPRPFGGPEQFVSFDETTAINYEAGLKGRLDNISFMASMFYTDYTDLAFPFSDPTSGGGFVTIIENAGKSRAQGIELESTIELTDNFSVRTAIGYLDAEITEIDEGVIGIGVGDTPALTPEWTIMIAPSYVRDMDNGGVLIFNMDYSYRSDMNGQSIYNPYEVLDSRELVGFNLKYENPQGDWNVSLYGENIFNEIYDQGRLAQTGYVGVVRSNDRSEFGLRFEKSFELE